MKSSEKSAFCWSNPTKSPLNQLPVGLCCSYQYPIISPLCTIIFHCVPLYSIVYHCISLCTITSHYVPLHLYIYIPLYPHCFSFKKYVSPWLLAYPISIHHVSLFRSTSRPFIGSMGGMAFSGFGGPDLRSDPEIALGSFNGLSPISIRSYPFAVISYCILIQIDVYCISHQKKTWNSMSIHEYSFHIHICLVNPRNPSKTYTLW